jgi:hypothetical protein
MIKYNNFIVLFTLIIFLFACTKSFNSIDEFEKYVKGNDYPYLQTLNRKGIEVSLRYIPTDLIMIRFYREYEKNLSAVKQDTTLSQIQLTPKINDMKKELEQHKESFSKSVYFYLNIGFENDKDDIVYNSMNSGFENYSEWLQRMLFGMKEFIYMKTPNAGVVPLSLYHMDRTYGLTKDRTLLLSFPTEFNDIKLLEEKNITLIIKEFGLHTGRFVFEYKLLFKKIKLNI